MRSIAVLLVGALLALTLAACSRPSGANDDRSPAHRELDRGGGGGGGMM